MAVPLWQFIVCAPVVSYVVYVLSFYSLSLLLLVCCQGHASCLWHFLGSFTFILVCQLLVPGMEKYDLVLLPGRPGERMYNYWLHSILKTPKSTNIGTAWTHYFLTVAFLSNFIYMLFFLLLLLFWVRVCVRACVRVCVRVIGVFFLHSLLDETKTTNLKSIQFKWNFHEFAFGNGKTIVICLQEYLIWFGVLLARIEQSWQWQAKKKKKKKKKKKQWIKRVLDDLFYVDWEET